MENQFTIRTPDDNYLHFDLLDEKATEKLLNNEKHYSLPANKLDLFGKTAYSLEHGKVVHLRFSDGNSLLFDNEVEYLRSIKGTGYYETHISYDKENEVFASFSLQPAYGARYFELAKHELNEYPPVDRYKAYLLTTGQVCFLRNRIGLNYDGYWYPTKRDFEFFYYLLKD